MIDHCLILILENLTCSELVHKRLLFGNIGEVKKYYDSRSVDSNVNDSDHLIISSIGIIHSIDELKDWLPMVKVIYQGPGAKEEIAVAAFASDSEQIAAQVARTEHLRFGPWQLKTWAFTDYNMYLSTKPTNADAPQHAASAGTLTTRHKAARIPTDI
ncbi:hypothetical protein BLOT_013143 [Blomia tropicalis]|nr:hypothetical protein BLOT_013143 [Blomia tropicalis]